MPWLAVASKKQKARTGRQPNPGRMHLLQSKDGQVLRLHSCRALSPGPHLRITTKFEYSQEQSCRNTKLKSQVGDLESPKGTYFDPGWSLLIRPVTVSRWFTKKSPLFVCTI